MELIELMENKNSGIDVIAKPALEPVLLDARNLLCPMPVIRLQNKMGKMQKGEEVLVLCTDPGTKSDIPTWCRMNHREVLWIKEEGFEIHFLVRA
jgi:tRNA 2-thiouridine synthesizing protein A